MAAHLYKRLIFLFPVPFVAQGWGPVNIPPFHVNMPTDDIISALFYAAISGRDCFTSKRPHTLTLESLYILFCSVP